MRPFSLCLVHTWLAKLIRKCLTCLLISPFRAINFALYCSHAHLSSSSHLSSKRIHDETRFFPLPLVSPAACTDALVTAHNSQAFPPMARDEQQKLLASGPVQGEPKEAMSGTDSADTAPVPPSPCDYCSGMPAAVYCRADSARLCLPCDRHVHGANTVSSSHGRAPLCAVCLAAAAAFRCAALFLCSNCEFEKHRDDRALGVPLHDRRTVEGYTGCPSVSELAAILGVDVECDKAANEGWWPVWEVPQVLSLDDVIVPTTSCHGFQPLMPSSPKNRSSPGGELNEEVLRQLGELAKSEATAYVEAEPAGDQLPSWASSDYAIGHGDFGAFGTETSHEAASMATPSYEHEAWIAIDCNDPTDACEAEVLREQVPVSSAAEPCLSSFVQISEICPSMSRSSSIDNSSQDPATVDVPTQALPKKGGYDISYPDRGTVISRYREKRKNRRFGKQIRYESRKARADGRLRIKGRFAKSN